MALRPDSAARRRFLQRALTATGAIAALPGLPTILDGINTRTRAGRDRGGYGPLIPAADLRDGVERIALPEGFRYRSFSWAGEIMSDGHRVPLAHDGMGVFPMPDGTFRLVRNHEDRNPPGGGSAAADANAYDANAGAGTTTLIVNPFTRELERDFISLSGTTVNCAGGVTPWGSWITCEETTVGPTTKPVAPLFLPWLKQHGYCFDVPATADSTVAAVALPAMGRFSHEAVAVDPTTGIVYETEDNSGGNGTSGFYRFVPDTPGVLANGGTLQMLAIDGQFMYDARWGQTVGAPLPVTWVTIPDPDPAGTSLTAVFDQGRLQGGARFRRLEGCWWGNGAVYFNDTNGGGTASDRPGFGTVWEFRPHGNGGTLTMIFESSGQAVLDFPDNLAVSPQNALLLCEDGGGEQYMRGLTLAGELFDFARNLETDHEWAGATFGEADPRWNDRRIRGSHPPLGSQSDRVTLFVNRQGETGGPNPPAVGREGMTFAIWGPWTNGAL